MDINQLERIANQIVSKGKGILAADESTGTMTKRLSSIDVESTEKNRRNYRELLFRAEGMQYIGGVILYDETIRQKSEDGTSLVKIIEEKGSIPGIKVDTGAKPLSGSQEEKVTEGLDGLRERYEEYYSLGARFAKWRAVISIGKNFPTDYCINVNAHALARYAALAQEKNIVPIVEPEVLMDGENDIDQCYKITKKTLQVVFDELNDQKVDIRGILLKPNMVVSGKKCPAQAGIEEVAEKTIKCFKEVLPDSLPGIVFLSGGQSEILATEHLNAMNVGGKCPWTLSFSYGRALQQSALKVWAGKENNSASAQNAFSHRAKMNSHASTGTWTAEKEKTC